MPATHVCAQSVAYAHPFCPTPFFLGQSRVDFAESGANVVSQMGGRMNVRAIVLTMVLCLFGVSVCYAADANMGTWKLNEAKSTLAPGTPKNTMVVYAAVGDEVQVTVDGVDGAGKPMHNEWKGKFDGKDYAVTGDSSTDTRSYKKSGDRKLELINKKDGKATASGSIVVSADGKTRTLFVSGTDAEGKKVSSTAVYDKQ